jgi:SagB-type dehydrogenase family enzyme
MNDDIRAGRRLLGILWDDIDFEATDQARGVPVPPRFRELTAGAAVVTLAPRERWSPAPVSVVEAILARKSVRRFSPQPLGIEALSLLLFCTQGVHRQTEKATFRTVPSAGARHAFETYVYADRVTGLEKGLYRHLPSSNQLGLERAYEPGMEQELAKATYDQLYGAAVYLIWTAVPYRMEWRYAGASAKLIALDAGHVCENLYLACQAVGAGTCAIGAYDQRAVDGFVGVDGVEELSVYLAPVGLVGD